MVPRGTYQFDEGEGRGRYQFDEGVPRGTYQFDQGEGGDMYQFVVCCTHCQPVSSTRPRTICC